MLLKKTRLLSLFLLPALLLCSYAATADNTEAYGKVSWNNQDYPIERVLCEMSANDFIMRAQGENFHLRLAFRGEGSVESADFSRPTRIDLVFDREHPNGRALFAMSVSLGDMGSINANAEGAKGELHLRPGDAGALEYSADGLAISYEFSCKR